MKVMSLATFVFLTACASTPAPAELPQAPWQQPALTNVPQVFRSEWQKAENRSTCALVAFADHGNVIGATPRRANFSGGWAVAFDTPSRRSAFGIAGTGTTPEGSYQWPDGIRWSDGSSASYGLEGGTGPNHLAYVTIAGQECLYNVWSALGKEHLEHLLRQMRFVK